jgi:hypothetical protein
MTTPVPTLSAAGWVYSASEKADMLIAHWYESNASQSLIYGSAVSNAQVLIERFGHDIVELSIRIKSALISYLSAYYQDVTVNISTDEKTALNGRVTVTIECNVVENGKVYSFGKLLTLFNSKIEKIISITNG